MPTLAEAALGSLSSKEEKKRQSARRITIGELIALRLILRSIEENIRAAMTAENTSDRKSAHMIALSQLYIAQEITRDSATL